MNEEMFSVVCVAYSASSAPEAAQHRRHQDGDRVREGPEFEYENDENENHGHQQHLRQSHERLMLDLVESAEFDVGAGRKSEFP